MRTCPVLGLVALLLAAAASPACAARPGLCEGCCRRRPPEGPRRAMRWRGHLQFIFACIQQPRFSLPDAILTCCQVPSPLSPSPQNQMPAPANTPHFSSFCHLLWFGLRKGCGKWRHCRRCLGHCKCALGDVGLVVSVPAALPAALDPRHLGTAAPGAQLPSASHWPTRTPLFAAAGPPPPGRSQR
jgi:hypothetical protein